LPAVVEIHRVAHVAFALYPTADSLAVPPLVPAPSPLVPFLVACGAVRVPEEHLEMSLAL